MIGLVKISTQEMYMCGISTVTYLGLTLDQSLSCDAVASGVLSKTSNKLKFLYRNARKFNIKQKNTNFIFDSM